ncbi:MAG: hypothetical protein ACT4OJ_05215 [Bacteroidota bacterium]
MSSVQHKLMNYELPPPEGLWQKIANELDDSASGLQFPVKLIGLAVEPSASVWNKIAENLDAASVSDDIPAQLYAAEVIPPVAAWNKIQTSLDAEKSAGSGGEAAVPEHRRLSPMLRYAAAAAVIGLIAFGALQFFQADKKNTGIASSGNLPETKTAAPVPVMTGRPDIQHADIVTNTSDEEARNDAALEASKKTYARLDIPVQKRTDMASAFNFAHLVSTRDIHESGSSGYQEGLGSGDNNANRYIVLMTPDGHFIRMSKKLSSLVCCVSGEEQDANCKNQVQKWRKQLACSDAAHPGNFLDILSLVGSLQDN